ncbi:hypothetical protein Peur_030675 [Populus x canadensis]
MSRILANCVNIPQVEHVKAERNLLAEVASHCTVKLYYSFQDAEYLYLIMEYLPGGDIRPFLHKHNYIHRNQWMRMDAFQALVDGAGKVPLNSYNIS